MAAPRDPIRTARLLLEPVAACHAADLHEATVTSRAALLPWMPWARAPSLAAGEAMVRECMTDWEGGREYHFAIVLDRRAVGVVGLNRERDAFDLHYWIASGCAGRGLVTEAAEAVVEWARQVLDAVRFTLWAGRANAPSLRVAAKLGFRRLGPLDRPVEGGQGPFEADAFALD